MREGKRKREIKTERREGRTDRSVRKRAKAENYSGRDKKEKEKIKT